MVPGVRKGAAFGSFDWILYFGRIKNKISEQCQRGAYEHIDHRVLL